MSFHQICNNCGEIYEAIYTDSPDDTTTLPDSKQTSDSIGTKNKIENKSYRYQCPFCGSVKPKISYHEENELTHQAFQLLEESRFKEADAAFDAVLAEYPKNVEAHWGKVKAKYRVIYKENLSGKKVPTCEKTDHESVFKDEHYIKAFLYADDRIREFLKKQANEIDRIRGIKKKKIVKILTSVLPLATIAVGIVLFFIPKMPVWIPILLLGLAVGALGAALFLSKPLKFAYIVNADQATCTITGIGICKDTRLVIPETIDGYKVTKICDKAFYGRALLRSIVIPDSVKSIGNSAFAGCWSLINIVIPDSVTSIGVSAFEACKSLISIIIPDSVTSIGDRAFKNCTRLKSAAISKGVSRVSRLAFESCTSLMSIELPDSITSIAEGAFFNCTSLTSIAIPGSVTKIKERAFMNCTSLTEIRYSYTSAQWKNIAKDSESFANTGSYTIICTHQQHYEHQRNYAQKRSAEAY